MLKHSNLFKETTINPQTAEIINFAINPPTFEFHVYIYKKASCIHRRILRFIYNIYVK